MERTEFIELDDICLACDELLIIVQLIIVWFIIRITFVLKGEVDVVALLGGLIVEDTDELNL